MKLRKRARYSFLFRTTQAPISYVRQLYNALLISIFLSKPFEFPGVISTEFSFWFIMQSEFCTALIKAQPTTPTISFVYIFKSSARLELHTLYSRCVINQAHSKLYKNKNCNQLCIHSLQYESLSFKKRPDGYFSQERPQQPRPDSPRQERLRAQLHRRHDVVRWLRRPLKVERPCSTIALCLSERIRPLGIPLSATVFSDQSFD